MAVGGIGAEPLRAQRRLARPEGRHRHFSCARTDGVMKHSDTYEGKRNNHYYWEGLAVGPLVL